MPRSPARDRQARVQPRKTPRQARARETRRAILEAAARVLRAEGPAAFNTNRVAEVAGVSVGSLYQYFPNKAALLFQLDVLDSKVVWEEIEALLGDRERSPRERVDAAVERFFRSEAEEAALRGSLRRAEAFFEHTPQIEARNAFIRSRLRQILAELVPAAGGRDLDFDAELFATTVASVSEAVTDRTTDPAQIGRFARATSEMLCRQLGIEERPAR
ncbi:MAG TPA: TetR/AcrR family transcriptional regulator [Myxococcota bacterium]|nr:TetR/AcrR family transcriptional regulator [Myxococcota bacterium]